MEIVEKQGEKFQHSGSCAEDVWFPAKIRTRHNPKGGVTEQNRQSGKIRVDENSAQPPSMEQRPEFNEDDASASVFGQEEIKVKFNMQLTNIFVVYCN